MIVSLPLLLLRNKIQNEILVDRSRGIPRVRVIRVLARTVFPRARHSVELIGELSSVRWRERSSAAGRSMTEESQSNE